MILWAVCFIAGILSLQFFPVPPSVPVWLPLLLIPGLLNARLRLPLCFVLGFCWAAFHNQSLLATGIPEQLEGETVLVEGRILERPVEYPGQRLRFPFQVMRMDDGSGWRPFAIRVRLDWYEANTEPAAGERWQLAVRLRQPHGYANPGGFDYELWLFQKRIRATGYVRTDRRNRQIDAGHVSPLETLRDRLAQATGSYIDELPSMALVQALTIGERNRISAGQWQVLRATGTSHLMAISGLHISLVAGLVFWCTRMAWSRSVRLSAYVPSAHGAALAALMAGLLYALLSGFAIPAQRALVMVGVFMLAMIAGRPASFPAVIALAAVLTLLLDPVSILATGWWLSFWAVTVIAWFTVGRHGRQPRHRRWLMMPAVLAFCMAPVLMLFFQQVSLLAPLANIVAVPWVSFLVVPLALAGTLLFLASEQAGLLLLQASAWLLESLWVLLDWLAGPRFALLGWPQPSLWVLILAIGGVMLLCLPRGIPARWPGVLLLLPLLVTRPQPLPGEVWATLLDVGQGLAVIVRTARHTLVYDTGPAYGADFDTGRAVVAPYLHYQGLRTVDRLVISHGDNDHIGGARSLLSLLPVTEIMTSVPVEFPARQPLACLRGHEWIWDGVRFAVLHPDRGDGFTGNNASCVLRIETADGQALLLTGDIERPGEQALLDRYGEGLAADVLVVPHHGSLTSSSEAFVRTVRPAHALIPSGYRNRYRLPQPAVVARYRAAGSHVLETGRSGAITVRLSPHAATPRISRFRVQQTRFWRRPALETGQFGY